MPELRIRNLTESEATQQIVETVRQSGPGAAPFALVLGAGFSHGLVPTSREVVEFSLPLWMYSLEVAEPFEKLLEKRAAYKPQARIFWRQFVERNKNRGLLLPLEPDSGLPKDVPAAYRAAFNPD